MKVMVNFAQLLPVLALYSISICSGDEFCLLVMSH